jgi:WD40 repeat protein
VSGHPESVRGAAWSPDGTRVVSASFDGTLRIWDAASGVAIATLSGHTSWVNSAAWSLDGTWVVSASIDKTLRLWDAASGTQQAIFYADTRLNCCACSPIIEADGRVRVAAGDSAGRVLFLRWQPPPSGTA